MVSGGAEATITSLAIGGFTSMSALTTASDPKRASIPFDKERSGFVMGEGAGILVLEELEHAKARGAKIYGEIVGYGTNCDAHHITAPDPTGTWPAACIQQALSDAGIAPEQVDYVNAHGTSTPLNDSGETAALKKVFGDHAGKLMQLHQVHDRPHAGGRRRGGGHLQPAGPEGRLCPRNHQLSGARPRL